jgi:REP element-mobilizing transposase RayT
MSQTPSYPQRRHPRLADYDYMTPGYYFVTICTHHRLPLFGSIPAGTMHLSPAGKMAQDAWDDLAALHLGVAIDTDVVMPDHLHAIVVLVDDPHRTLSLPAVIHRYKSLTTKRYAHAVRAEGWPRFAGKLWQESFYDHVIRQDGELDEVRRYIAENALRWEVRRSQAEGARGG